MYFRSFSLLLCLGWVAQAQSAVGPLNAYSGTWRVTRQNSEKTELLQNSCAPLGTYFGCQQSTNGAVSGVLLFIPNGAEGHFLTQTVTPSGRATGTGELQVSSGSNPKWTFLSSWNNGSKVIRYRTTDTFTNRNKIIFEQEESEDGGKTWKETGSGEYIRTSASK